MNRRELFQQIAAVTAGAGIASAKVSTVEADAPTKPAMILIECDSLIEQDTAARIREWVGNSIEPAFGRIPVVVLCDGLRLTMLDANGRPLNRTLEDA